MDAATTHEPGDQEQHRAIRQAQDVEYAQAEADDLQRQTHRPDADEAGHTEPASPPLVDADLVRRVRTRRFALDSDDPHRGH